MFKYVNTLMLALLAEPLHNSRVMIHRIDVFEKPEQPPRFAFLPRNIDHTVAELRLDGRSLLVAQAVLEQSAPQHSKGYEDLDATLQDKLSRGEPILAVEAWRLTNHCKHNYYQNGNTPSLDIATAFTQLHERKIRSLAKAGLYGTQNHFEANHMKSSNSSPNVAIQTDYTGTSAASITIHRSIDPSEPHTRFRFFFPENVSN